MISLCGFDPLLRELLDEFWGWSEDRVVLWRGFFFVNLVATAVRIDLLVGGFRFHLSQAAL